MANGMITELEAVNKILAVSGDTPVQTLEDNYIQAQLALQILQNESRNIQINGWWFNQDENVRLLPNTSDVIELPYNILKVKVLNTDRYAQRGLKIYDRQERTYTITDSVQADLVILLEWNELPQSARQHIINAAKITYNNTFHGDPSLEGRLDQEFMISLTGLEAEDISNRDINVFNNQRVRNIAFRNRRVRG